MKAIRRLSDVEASFALLHAALAGTTQVATLVTVDGLFERRALTVGVRSWARRLPILRLRIVEERDSLWFAEGPDGIEPGQLRIGLLPSFLSPEDLLTAELNDVLPTGGPLWRLRVAADPASGRTHLLFVRNHAISDGYSTSWIVRELLDRLFGAARPTDDAHARVSRNGDELTARALGGRPPQEPASSAALPFFARRRWPERGTGFESLSFSPAESQAIKRSCKEGGITVNQFFAAALTEAFGSVTGRTELDFFTAASLRGRYQEEPALADLGCFITVLKQPVRADGLPLPAAAQRYRSGFGQADAAWRPTRRTHAEIRRSVLELGALEAFPGICITNLGVLDPALGPHAERVTAFRTVVNRTAANYAVVLHLSTFKGAFEAALAYGTPAMDPAVAADTARLLRELALAELGALV
ncbi:hypothetical protein P3T36_001401 [Kitasatospora sp. MAP12-15]|uniref:hypothetical protein n=1 Tax=unclassified Kitasatospora TaxID=2633591 RepID=UPI002476C014|nr:hypothetical protein [Kitasatospora sp. MAP12-44]MDH6112518.1 hypothetical protein [Kitasatospora sp. MAP12-44]